MLFFSLMNVLLSKLKVIQS